ncbi:hypothetical protein H696_04714 [Fonticula alba]|uniref:Uncharacterized protein n=1 Tax=Fonticula alba TaxID=691883 RepID=A0A058Z2E0_FONAL|nr:hypothetical protein H696_04714 [Fonticula alba]KCV68420.1 hypothetical protein H696_04714 [Fonticula alba]|eukprot:XP_009496852.1 hypothetical protein H696_04714 [Fonticula alba]
MPPGAGAHLADRRRIHRPFSPQDPGEDVPMAMLGERGPPLHHQTQGDALPGPQQHQQPDNADSEPEIPYTTRYHSSTRLRRMLGWPVRLVRQAFDDLSLRLQHLQESARGARDTLQVDDTGHRHGPVVLWALVAYSLVARYANFLRLHVAYIVLVCLLCSLAVWLIESHNPATPLTGGYFDSFAAAAVTVSLTGMSIVPLSDMHTASLVVCMVCTILCSNILLSVVPVLIRRSYFERTLRRTLVMDRRMRDRQPIELRALTLVIRIALCYFAAVIVLGTVVLLLLVTLDPSARAILRQGGVVFPPGAGPGGVNAGEPRHPLFWALFHTISAFSTIGTALHPDSFAPWAGHPSILWFFASLTFLGHSLYPIIFRAIVAGLHRWVGRRRAGTPYAFLLAHPRHCYTHMFSRVHTRWLLLTVVVMFLFELFTFIGLEWNKAIFTGMGQAQRLANTMFTIASNRTTGSNSISVPDTVPVAQFLMMCFMMISSTPIHIALRYSTIPVSVNGADKVAASAASAAAAAAAAGTGGPGGTLPGPAGVPGTGSTADLALGGVAIAAPGPSGASTLRRKRPWRQDPHGGPPGAGAGNDPAPLPGSPVLHLDTRLGLAPAGDDADRPGDLAEEQEDWLAGGSPGGRASFGAESFSSRTQAAPGVGNAGPGSNVGPVPGGDLTYMVPEGLSAGAAAEVLAAGGEVANNFDPATGGPNPAAATSLVRSRETLRAQVKSSVFRHPFFLFLAMYLILILETDNLGIGDPSRPGNITIFNILFEVVSAYGNIGLSLGYPGAVTSLSGRMTLASRLIILLTMLLGRHRHLPHSIDSAVNLFPDDLVFLAVVEQQLLQDAAPPGGGGTDPGGGGPGAAAAGAHASSDMEKAIGGRGSGEWSRSPPPAYSAGGSAGSPTGRGGPADDGPPAPEGHHHHPPGAGGPFTLVAEAGHAGAGATRDASPDLGATDHSLLSTIGQSHMPSNPPPSPTQ